MSIHVNHRNIQIFQLFPCVCIFWHVIFNGFMKIDGKFGRVLFYESYESVDFDMQKSQLGWILQNHQILAIRQPFQF